MNNVMNIAGFEEGTYNECPQKCFRSEEYRKAGFKAVPPKWNFECVECKKMCCPWCCHGRGSMMEFTCTRCINNWDQWKKK